ncbi:hypothetical protein KZZ52_01865 [Dactylosporangium sp. AC04546]|uniref:hypothetical protein n=1 Tax=Dactylosporangium sp. AC04546 TaxID=2862460 RepID=UPI001EE0F414|nr:hypothetical protein [Dactylosporangium sp. AC04546]WVK84205.1 hypothetical protein KZZ52_01865 [Dactylosporangium sp. AC04546]
MTEHEHLPGMFGFLATRLSVHPENVATEGLAYVLQTSIPVARAFEDYLGRCAHLPAGLHYVTQATGEDGAIPDLAGIAGDGSAPLLVEAKFLAGLTDHQPVSYLQRLPADQPAMLLFIVPSARLELLWTEVLARSAAGGLSPTAEQGNGEYRHALVGAQHVLAVTSWRALLMTLVDAAIAANDPPARSNLDQLRGLCERMDSQAFVPLTVPDLSGSVAVRLLQYIDLIDRTVKRLANSGVASMRASDGSALRSKAADGWWGRYLALAGVTCLLRLSAQSWATDRATPIWLQIGYRGKPSASVILHAIGPLQAQRNRVFARDEGFVDVAIDLPVHVETDAVVDSMVQQISLVASYLQSAVQPRSLLPGDARQAV